MRLPALLVVGLLGCGGTSPAPDTKPPIVKDVKPVEPKKPEVDPSWDPSKPIDLSTVKTHTMFVVVRQSALCPTREQAKARECGNSTESVGEGTIEDQGSAITIVGDEAIDGMWKGLRFQKAGIMPSWIRADDVAKTPKTDSLDAFDKRPDVAKAVDVTKSSAKKLARLRKGTVVKWSRTRAVKYGEFQDRTFVYVASNKAPAAIELPPPGEGRNYIENHVCLMAGDCIGLSYICNDHYCDEVSILATATGRKTPAPEDPEGEWTGRKRPMPVFEVIAIADRFGTFPESAN